jgi:hypothetical protein
MANVNHQFIAGNNFFNTFAAAKSYALDRVAALDADYTVFITIKRCTLSDDAVVIPITPLSHDQIKSIEDGYYSFFSIVGSVTHFDTHENVADSIEEAKQEYIAFYKMGTIFEYIYTPQEDGDPTTQIAEHKIL